MIIPSIDLQDGQTVQLVGGEKLAIEAGDPLPLARRFGRVGEIAVIDLNAAKGSEPPLPNPVGEGAGGGEIVQGANAHLIKPLLGIADIRVGGGIRTYDTARDWLDAGAAKVILGTAATPELLRQLPRERVIAALDARFGEVVVHGWQTGTGTTIQERMRELRPYVGGFLVTFVELEGRLGGTAMDQVAEFVALAGHARVTIAGGVTTAAEIAELHRLGADAQVGMALYAGRLSLAEGYAAALTSDRPDGLWSTVVCDEHGQALGLAYSNLESLSVALERGVGAYWSRKRGLWIKGETSGSTQELLKVEMDCDADALRFTVRQTGPFCHLETPTCWGRDAGLARLARRLSQTPRPPGSYVQRLFDDPTLVDLKLVEEARELAEAGTAAEAADVIFFTLVKALKNGVSLPDIERELARRERKVTRRKGDAKDA